MLEVTVCLDQEKNIRGDEEMPIKKKKVFGGLTSFLASVFAISPGFAQDQQASGASVLDEIVVTARKRGEERLQDIPATISVFSEDILQKMGVSDFEDFAYQVPGLTFSDRGPGEKRYIVRGVQSAGQQQVAVYYDEVPLPGVQDSVSNSGSQTTDLKIYDMARVEVLKGPQGTAFGANSQTGTLRFITNKPKLDEFEGSIRGDVSGTSSASGENWSLSGMINVPIIADKLGVRLVAYDGRDIGYVDNTRLNLVDINEVETWGIRGLARWEPTEKLSFDFMVWVQRRDTGGRFDYMPFNTIFDDSLTREQKVALSSDQGGRDSVAEFTQFPTGKFMVGDYPQTPTPDDQDIYSITMNWELPWANLTATGSYYERELVLISDSSFILPTFGIRPATPTDPGVRPDLFPAGADQTQSLEQTAVEVRLNSTHGGPLQWLFGTFWRERPSKFRSYIPVIDPVTGLPFDPGVAPGEIQPPNVGAGIEDCLPCVFARINNREIDEIAVFGELSYDITSKLEATIGLRWFDVEQTDFGITVFPFALFPPSPPISDTREFSEDAVIKKFQLSFKPNDDLIVYALASQGFRLGGTNQQGIVAVPPFYGADDIWNIEGGLKSQWFDNRVVVNAAVFHIIWDNLQVEGRDPLDAFGFIGNAGEAEVTGLEVEVFASPNENWDFSFGSSWLPRHELTEDQITSEVVAPGRKGDDIPRIPTLTANAMAQYSFPLQMGSGWLRGEVSHRSGSSTDFRPFEVLGGDSVNSSSQREQRDFQIVNLRAGLRSDALEAELTLFVENVFDEEGDVFIRAQSGHPTRKITNRPRTFGIQINKHF